MGNELLPLLGLCRRANLLIVGDEPVEAAARAHDARVLLLASDAAGNTVRRVRHFSEMGNCPLLTLPFTKAELGGAVGRSVCAVAAVTDIGFAANIVRRLAAAEPEQYGQTAALLEQKSRKAARRKAEALAHEKNLRQGRGRKKAAAEASRPQPALEKLPEKSPGPARNRSGGEGSSSGGNRNFPGRRFSSHSAPPSRSGVQRRFQNSRPVKKGKGSPKKQRDA